MPDTSMIYLDHAAATPLRPEAAEAMARAEAEAFANPSSTHAEGRRAKRLLEDSRERILLLLGGTPSGHLRDLLVFTSGATEANRLGILGMAVGMTVRRPSATDSSGRILVSARDHASIHAAAAAAVGRGFRVDSLPLTAGGIPDRTGIHDVVNRPATNGPATIATVTVVCGQSGIVDDPAAVAAGLSAVVLHADATQSVGWLDLPFRECGAATMAIAAHKFGGPRGIGGLVVRHGRPIEPIAAGSQESGLRGGTEPVALAAGFAAALEAAVADRQESHARVARLRDRFEREIIAAARAMQIDAAVAAEGRDRAPHISTIFFPGIDRQAVVMAADLAGIACATGAACSSGSSEPAPALLAMPFPPGHARSAVRFSFGTATTDRDIDEALRRLSRILADMAMGGGMGLRKRPS